MKQAMIFCGPNEASMPFVAVVESARHFEDEKHGGTFANGCAPEVMFLREATPEEARMVCGHNGELLYLGHTATLA